MNKPLLQWKREIEERLKIIEKFIYISSKDMCISLSVEKKCLEKQLQMIDDIIDMTKEALKDVSSSMEYDSVVYQIIGE